MSAYERDTAHSLLRGDLVDLCLRSYTCVKGESDGMKQGQQGGVILLETCCIMKGVGVGVRTVTHTVLSATQTCDRLATYL